MKRTPSQQNRRGFILITTVVSAVVLLTFLGFAIDVGYLEWQKTRMQTAADAAAIAGVQELRMNGAGGVTAAARGDSSLNGFTDGSNAVTVTVNNPPKSGYYTSDSTAVEVIVSQNVPTFFMVLAGSSSVNVRARAVARQGPGTACVYVLDPSASGAFSVSNGVNVQLDCGVMVDSSSSTGFTASGGAVLKTLSTSVTGNYSITNGASVTPTPVAHVPAQTDPLAYVSAPSVPALACAQNTNPASYNITSATYGPQTRCNALTVGNARVVNFTGGTYDSYGISIGGMSTVTFGSGTYILEGGGLSIGNGATVTFSGTTFILEGGGLNLGGGSHITGTGVTFYNTTGGTYGYKPMSIANGTSVTLSAPTTGSLAGILFFQDRNTPSVAANATDFSGGANVILSGSLYFPSVKLTYNNGSNTNASYTILVAKTLSFSGGTRVKADYSSLPNGAPVRGGAALGE